jgi:hypothetical protein
MPLFRQPSITQCRFPGNPLSLNAAFQATLYHSMPLSRQPSITQCGFPGNPLSLNAAFQATLYPFLLDDFR